jgi:transposase
LLSALEISLARELMSDEEWAFHERFILAVRAPNGRKPMSHRLVLDGIFWIARTGSPWRDLPQGFGQWSSVYRQLRRWTLAGLWRQIMAARNASGLVPAALAASRFEIWRPWRWAVAPVVTVGWSRDAWARARGFAMSRGAKGGSARPR